MQTLLVDFDECRVDRWRHILASVSDVTVIDQCDNIARKAALQRFSAIIINNRCLARWATAADQLLPRLHLKCPWVACVVQREDPIRVASAYSLGFDECFFEDSVDDEILVKLRRVQLFENLSRQLERAQKLESIGELAAGIAHEINTPIQYVGDNTRFIQSAYVDLEAVLRNCHALLDVANQGNDLTPMVESLRMAIKDADTDYLCEEIPSAIRQTLEGVDRVANIVRAMKEFAHPGVSDMTPTDLSKAIENTVMVARNEWKYVADTETKFDPELPSVPCLPGELNQVLLNMIVNASHAIGEAMGESTNQKGKIIIETKFAPPYAEIRISDTGAGIPAANLERIFAPFFTTKAVGKGTGQGLAIARAVIVEKHGGTIGVESAVGKGTTFIIRLPLEMASPDADAPEWTPTEVRV
ncbi:MAG: ATP-binding protein [Pirellulaceae bacterium]